MPYKNNEQKNAVLSLIVMSAGILGALLPFFIHTDMEDRVFGAAFAGIITAITAFALFLIYSGKAKVKEKILCSIDILAHFYYSKEEWDQVNREDMKKSGKYKTAGSFIGGMILYAGFMVFTTDTGANGLFLLKMAGIAVFFAVTGFFASAAKKRRITGFLPEAVIAKEGLLFKNMLYTWNDKKISGLESAAYHPAVSDSLLFVLRRLSRNRLKIMHDRLILIQIPVPKGQERTAGTVISYFNLPMSPENREKIRQEYLKKH